MAETDETKWKIPIAFRVSTNAEDAAAYQRLLEADALQSELASHTPYFAQSPKARERTRAVVLIGELQQRNDLDDRERETLADAYATIGHYQTAADLSATRSELFAKYAQAVQRPDDEWCPHPLRHQYVRETVYDVRSSREAALLACNICGIWNVTDEPTRLKKQRLLRAEVRRLTRAGDTDAVKRLVEANTRR